MFGLNAGPQVVGCLVSHLGGGAGAAEIGASMHVLTLLTESSQQALAKFFVFLRTVLDYLHHFALEHVRTFFDLLTRLAQIEDVQSVLRFVIMLSFLWLFIMSDVSPRRLQHLL